jgi:hypothetical protein
MSVTVGNDEVVESIFDRLRFPMAQRSIRGVDVIFFRSSALMDSADPD